MWDRRQAGLGFSVCQAECLSPRNKNPRSGFRGKARGLCRKKLGNCGNRVNSGVVFDRDLWSPLEVGSLCEDAPPEWVPSLVCSLARAG